MEAMENQSYVFLGIKVKPGPIERYKIENFTLDNTVDTLKSEAEKKANIPSASLELIHHGRILKDNATLQDSGVKSGEMVHVVKKKEPAPATPSLNFSDVELQNLNATLRTLGCTPNANGWTRAMQLLNDESAMEEIMEHAPSLEDDCVTLSILHEVELLAALGANLTTMRRGADAYPDLVTALRHLMRLVLHRCPPGLTDTNPSAGFSYSIDALSDDEEAEEEELEDGEGRSPITQEQLAAALQAATEAVFTPARGGHEGLLQLLQSGEQGDSSTAAATASEHPVTAEQPIITAEMFSDAITEAMQRTRAAVRASENLVAVVDQNMTPADSAENPPSTTQEEPSAGSSGITVAEERAGGSGSSGGTTSGSGSSAENEFTTQLHRMHELGLLDDSLNLRALTICSGDVNAAINLMFSGVIGEPERM